MDILKLPKLSSCFHRAYFDRFLFCIRFSCLLFAALPLRSNPANIKTALVVRAARPRNFLAPSPKAQTSSNHLPSPSTRRQARLANRRQKNTMICRTCLRRAAGFSQRRPAIRSFTTSIPFRNAAATPELSTPLTNPGDEAPAATTEAKPSISACKEGTVLTGLNYLKNKNDPVAKADDEYPAWLWKCLEVQVKAEVADEGAGDEFCKATL